MVKGVYKYLKTIADDIDSYFFISGYNNNQLILKAVNDLETIYIEGRFTVDKEQIMILKESIGEVDLPKNKVYVTSDGGMYSVNSGFKDIKLHSKVVSPYIDGDNRHYVFKSGEKLYNVDEVQPISELNEFMDELVYKVDIYYKPDYPVKIDLYFDDYSLHLIMTQSYFNSL